MQNSNNEDLSAQLSAKPNFSKDNLLSRNYPITVLLVDDQAMIAEAIRRMLMPETDIGFHYCPNPTAVFEIIMKVKPTVILQDLVMPDVNGLELLQEYRLKPESLNIPVIVLSTREEPKVKSMAFKFGANDYLVKLPDTIELVARIRYHSKSYISQLQRDDALKELEKARSTTENPI